MNIDSKYYIVKSAGGYSPCILGNDSHGQRYRVGSVLPNCVGFAWGWWHEVAGLPKFNFFGRGDACSLFRILKDQGCRTGTRPEYGAMMCWDNGEAGHVAIVSEVLLDGSVRTLESGWEFTGEPVKQYVRSGDGWRKGCRWMGKTYKFLGFVYHPCIPRVVDQKYVNMDDGTILTLPTVYTAGRNYPQLAALGDAHLLRCGWDPERRLPEVGPETGKAE